MVTTVLEDILRLAELQEAEWPLIRARIPTWHPRCDGEGEEGEGEGGEGEGGEEGGGGEGEGSGGGENTVEHWKRMARQNEKRMKQERKARETAEGKLKDRDDLDKSENEKALEAARQEGEKTAREAAAKERRADRLETASVRLASKGFTVKGPDGDVTLTFADPDDAHLHIERMVRRGDLDEDELFDESGKVKNDVLQSALKELLEEKPHLRAGNGGVGTTRKVAGSADQGKGGGSSSDDLEGMSVEQIFEKRIGQRT